MTKRYTEEFLISEINRFIEVYECIPTAVSIGNAIGFPAYSTFITHFGSWHNALKEAGVPTYLLRNCTKEFLISDLHRFVEENGRSPKQIEMCNKNGYVSFHQIIKTFGSWNNALIEADIPLNVIFHTIDTMCYNCDSHNNRGAWYYNNNKQIICKKCYYKIRKERYPDYIKNYCANNRDKIYNWNHTRRGYGCTPLNSCFNASDGHHLWVENRSDFVIFIPTFLHEHYSHSNWRKDQDSLNQINCIALDYWINEELYRDLFELNAQEVY